MSQTPPIGPSDVDLSTLEPPTWPQVVGTISIVWGVIGMTCAGCGLAGPMIYRAILPPEMMNPPPPFVHVTADLILSVAMGVVVSIVLVWAGGATLARRGSGRTLHLVYAALAVASTAVGMYVQFRMQARMSQFVQQNPDHPMARSMGSGGVGQWIGLAFGLVLGLAYPIFCAVWFGLMGRRPDAGLTPEEQR